MKMAFEVVCYCQLFLLCHSVILERDQLFNSFKLLFIDVQSVSFCFSLSLSSLLPFLLPFSVFSPSSLLWMLARWKNPCVLTLCPVERFRAPIVKIWQVWYNPKLLSPLRVRDWALWRRFPGRNVTSIIFSFSFGKVAWRMSLNTKFNLSVIFDMRINETVYKAWTSLK